MCWRVQDTGTHKSCSHQSRVLRKRSIYPLPAACIPTGRLLYPATCRHLLPRCSCPVSDPFSRCYDVRLGEEQGSDRVCENKLISSRSYARHVDGTMSYNGQLYAQTGKED